MDVLLINQTYTPDMTATAQMGDDLARDLVSKGHRVRVIASRSLYGQKGAVLPRREVIGGVEIHRVGMSLFGKGSILARVADFVLFYKLAGWKALWMKRADVVVPFTTPPFIALLGWLLRVLKGSRYVYWVMDLYPDLPVACGVMKPNALLTRVLERVHRFCLRRADRVVVLGRCMRKRVLEKGVDGSKVRTINVWPVQAHPTPIDPESSGYRREWSLEGKFVVMYSGNFGLGHDVETMCGAALGLRDRDDIRFVFVGGGKRKAEIEAFAAEHGLENVRFEPYQPRERLDELLAAADLHLISLLDPVVGIMVPSKLYGILAAERPAAFVGHAESEIACVLSESGAGVTVSCGDATGLREHIESLAADRARAREMGRAGRRALLERYDRPHACAAWAAVLAEVSGSAGSRG